MPNSELTTQKENVSGGLGQIVEASPRWQSRGVLNAANIPKGSTALDNPYCNGSVPVVADVTQILAAAQEGDALAAEQLLPLVYEELRRLAAHRMNQEAPGHTLQPTALVHEAWLRLVKPEKQARFQNRSHFFAAAAEAMRRILIDSARRKMTVKRGGQQERVDLNEVEVELPMPADELIALDEALDRLREVDPRAAEVVKLTFYAGLSQEQAAKQLGMSWRTTERLLAFARAWLFREVKKAVAGGS